MFGNRARDYFLRKKAMKNEPQNGQTSNKETSFEGFCKLIKENMVDVCIAVLSDEYSENMKYVSDSRTTSMMIGGVGHDLEEKFEEVVGAAVARHKYKQAMADSQDRTAQPFSYVMLYDFNERNLLGGIGVHIQNDVVTTFVMDQKTLRRNNPNTADSEEVAGQLRIDTMFK